LRPNHFVPTVRASLQGARISFSENVMAKIKCGKAPMPKIVRSTSLNQTGKMKGGKKK
jgi:hypothetical protein